MVIRRGGPFRADSLSSPYTVPTRIRRSRVVEADDVHENGRKVRRDARDPVAGKRAPCRHQAPCGCEAATKVLRQAQDDKRGACCLRCPFPACVLEGGDRTALRRRTLRRAIEVARLRLSGLAVDEIAERAGLSRRSVFRLLAWLRERYAH